ncbi:DUF262 domain-containing protein [Mesorhizobium sp. M0129]|uniref:DUF262 domain-containing protein n=1 Tax=Mesorhizobium sp. M0129 TaxID=2956886 RepID=UPI0033358A58
MQLSPSDPDIQTIVARIKNGDLDLQPDFQRGEVWSTQKKRRLIDSILRNWYVPPIHTVVVPGSHRQEVLDGQQRLVAIRDFVNGHYPVDGNIPPFDERMHRLDGLRYNELPHDARRLFDNFTIRVMRVTDYQPEEPGELFFRLNAITNVTAAEQRNAFYGPVREQVKDLVSVFENHGNSSDTLGFSNSRMSYDDVISKFLCTLEADSLIVKLTANSISDRFRSNDPFSPEIIYVASESIDVFSRLRKYEYRIRFNKATLLSWLLFCASFVLHGRAPILSQHPSLLRDFEEERLAHRRGTPTNAPLTLTGVSERAWNGLISIYNDRSTSRVLDISSVILRDFILHFNFFALPHIAADELPFGPEKHRILSEAMSFINNTEPFELEYRLESTLDPFVWGRLR